MYILNERIDKTKISDKKTIKNVQNPTEKFTEKYQYNKKGKTKKRTCFCYT